ncbi:AMP-binding protein [soil metagenome]
MLSRFLEEAAAEDGAKTALTFEGRAYSYAELEGRANAVASQLRESGLGPGQRAAVILTNRPEWIIAMQAVIKTGAAVVAPMATGTISELTHVLDLTQPAVVIAESMNTAVLSSYSTTALRITIDDASDGFSSWTDVFASSSDEKVQVEVPEDAEAFLLMSSGTTGLPKAVRHSHESVEAMVHNWRWQAGMVSTDRVQFFFPACTVFGMSTILAAFGQRAEISFFRRFNLEVMLNDVQDSKITIGMASAPIAVSMASLPDLEKYDLSSLRYLVWGSTPISKDVAETVTARSGVKWLHAYGMTEAGSLATNPVSEPERWRLDSPGVIPPGTETRFLDEDLRDVPAGTPGELVVRSGQTMLGYLPPEADADVLMADGWVRTGDIGFLNDDGFLFLVDRAKELIKVSGFSVSPVEIEKTLFAHPDIDDCGVYRVSDPKSGERAAAAIVLRPGADVDEQILLDWAAERMSSYKRLARITFVDAIPRNPAGKVLRRKIPEMVEALTH